MALDSWIEVIGMDKVQEHCRFIIDQICPAPPNLYARFEDATLFPEYFPVACLALGRWEVPGDTPGGLQEVRAMVPCNIPRNNVLDDPGEEAHFHSLVYLDNEGRELYPYE